MSKVLNTTPKILIVRFSSFGDVIKASVLQRLLKEKYPKSHITYVTRGDYKELVEFNPHIDDLILFEKQPKLKELKSLLSLRKRFKKENFDIVIDAHSNLRSHLLTSFLKAPFKARYSKTRVLRFLLFVLNINFLKSRGAQEETFAKLLTPLDIRYDNKGSDLFFDPNKPYDELLSKYNLNNTPYIVLVTGAAWDGKQLSVKFYKEFIEKLSFAKPQLKIVLMGGKREVSRNKALEFSNTLNLTNNLNLLESIYIASKSKMTIGSDTGLSHGSEAAGGKVAVFLGPTSKETGAYPSKDGSIVFERDIFCRPCSKNGSSKCFWGLGTKRCLNFEPDKVLERLYPKL